MRSRYCPHCATALELRPSGGPDPDRPACPKCGFVHPENPTPTVQAWIDHLIGIFDIAYRCRLVGGRLEVSAESQEAEWFALADFPEPAFEGKRQAPARLREIS